MKAHIVTVKAYCEDIEVFSETFAGRNKKKDKIREASDYIKTYGEIHVTESNAKAWAVYKYSTGDKSIVHSFNIQKV